MATRNVGATQNLNRHSMATGGTVVKNRQLVRRELGAPCPGLITGRLRTLLTGRRRQTHLHAQLAQLSANLSDTENLLRMTSVQAEAMRGLGSWHGGL